MSRPNFRHMEYDMPLICGALEDYDDLARAYEEDTGESYDMELYEFAMMDEFNEAARLAENFTGNLRFHDVTVIGGHYYGFQFYVEEKFSAQFDLDKDSRYAIDNEDAHYYFDMCRSKVIRAADAEKRRIRKFLEGLRKDGYTALVCTAVFSNGEAMYARR